jgi:type VI secretion system secreted protein Hcp
MMASSYFLKIDGIEGQSVDKNHTKWIDVLSCSHGVLQNVSIQRGADVAGRGQFIPFTFTHAVDKATPKIQLACMKGTKLEKVEFVFCQLITGPQTPVYEVTMENVKVAKAEVKTVNTESGGEVTAQQAVEEVQLIAGKSTWKVTPIKADNTKDGAIEATFDQISND